jgi:effector-binding domain-containing protein
MLTEPKVVEFAAQPYVAIRALTTMQTMDTVLVPLHPQVFAWLAERDIRPGWLAQGDADPVGLPFWKYNVIDMARELEVEVGVPVPAGAVGDDRVLAGVLPAGRYATLRYTGHPDGLISATAFLLDWAQRQNLAFDAAPAAGDHWGSRLEVYEWASRLEVYETDPDPDMNKWTTQLLFRLAG